MRVFRKHNPQRNAGATDKAAGWISAGIIKVQLQFAKVLGRTSRSWKAKQQWIFLYVICFVFGGLSIFSVIQSFKTKSLSKVSAIKVPRSIHKESSVRITDNEFRQLQNFKRSLDSVSKKKLLETRPGLMDSVEMVEQLYYSQKK